MKHETSKEKEVVIEDTDHDFSYWLNRPYISEELRKELEKSDILIIPKEGIRDFDTPLFPVKTEEIFTYMRNKTFPNSGSVPANF